MKYKELQKWIIQNSEENYRKFSSSLLPNVTNINGVRLPKLRKLAKGIVDENWEMFIRENKKLSFEEIMLQGLVITTVECDNNKKMNLLNEFIPLIDNWAVCDTVCSSLKDADKNRDTWWNWLQQFIFSKKEFEVRFGLVMLIFHFVTIDYVSDILYLLPQICLDKYYAQMAAAWLVADCYVKHPDLVNDFLLNNTLPKVVHNKAIQKICESLRIDKDTKQKLKMLKK